MQQDVAKTQPSDDGRSNAQSTYEFTQTGYPFSKRFSHLVKRVQSLLEQASCQSGKAATATIQPPMCGVRDTDKLRSVTSSWFVGMTLVDLPCFIAEWQCLRSIRCRAAQLHCPICSVETDKNSCSLVSFRSSLSKPYWCITSVSPRSACARRAEGKQAIRQIQVWARTSQSSASPHEPRWTHPAPTRGKTKRSLHPCLARPCPG